MLKLKNVIVIVISLAAVGCSSPQLMQNLALKRAAFDFNCSASSLSAKEISNSTIGVTGCGKRAAYVMRGPCDNIGHCSAVLNSVESVENNKK